jgi:hypothetical protein
VIFLPGISSRKGGLKKHPSRDLVINDLGMERIELPHLP